VCTPFYEAKCLTIDKPFWAAFICGYCLGNNHEKVDDYNDCFEIGGSQIPARKPCPRRLEPHTDTCRSHGCFGVTPSLSHTLPPPLRNTRRYVRVLTKLDGVMLNADDERAPPAGANSLRTSKFFIKIKPGYQWLDLDGTPFDINETPSCKQASRTVVYESPSSHYTLADV
jgi:hypothetical protein|tara:strand:+ start:63 stop:575 length:513 start_codon:yes stop_codon:yes gene_type:complete